MTHTTISTQEQSDIKKYFGVALEELDFETFKKTQRLLRTKYHPDNFEKFEDETIREMATERFQIIEALSKKIEAHFQQDVIQISANRGDWKDENARFEAKKLKIEIRTADKTLKYHLFGKRNYKWLLYGETYTIPNTTTSIVMDEDHRGSRIGYQETIRMYLSFGEEQVTEDVANWIYDKIKESADILMIAGEKIEIDSNAILAAIRQKTFLRIATVSV